MNHLILSELCRRVSLSLGAALFSSPSDASTIAPSFSISGLCGVLASRRAARVSPNPTTTPGYRMNRENVVLSTRRLKRHEIPVRERRFFLFGSVISEQGSLPLLLQFKCVLDGPSHSGAKSGGARHLGHRYARTSLARRQAPLYIRPSGPPSRPFQVSLGGILSIINQLSLTRTSHLFTATM